MGRGRGLGSVLRAMRGARTELVAIVVAAQCCDLEFGPTDAGDEPTVAELRESLQALTGDDTALARALRRPLTIDRLGTHSLGNLILHALASAFGDLAAASAWLGSQLQIHGAVLPATVEPLRYTLEPLGCRIEPGPPTVGAQPPGPIVRRWSLASGRTRLVGDRPAVPAEVVEAIARASVVLLAPGPLLGGNLVAALIPELIEALEATTARVVWISNLTPARDEAGRDQLAALRRERVRVDAVLHDPAASLRFETGELRRAGIESIARPLAGARRGVHDQVLLRIALSELMSAWHLA
ncbi:MAG: 2-phospho-L-lactate transferase CofD family protein [Solirubrobacteraceae bacterium]